MRRYLRGGGGIALFVFGSPALYFGAVYAGLAETLGYETMRKTFGGPLARRRETGTSLGLRRFYFRKGQTIFVDYDVRVAYGAFKIFVFEMYVPIGKRPGRWRTFAHNETGTAEFPVEASGYYALQFGGSPTGSGYDVSYDIRWGVR
jgi:hypothetical protein